MFWLWKRSSQAALFWRWLEQNRVRLHRDLIGLSAGKKNYDLTVIELSRRLKRVHLGLMHEIGMASDEVAELIISADGVREVFPFVIDLVRDAPTIEGFKITAFRPRNPALAMSMFNRELRAGMFSYRLTDQGERLGLDLYVDADLTEDQRTRVAFMMLDQALGEFDVEQGIGSINIEAGRPDGASPLINLASDFDARRAQTAH